MANILTANANNPPVGGIAAALLFGKTNHVEISWGNENSITFAGKTKLICESNNDLLRALARDSYPYNLFGETVAEKSQVDHWLTFSLTCSDNISWAVSYLEKTMSSLTYLVANKLTIADLALFNEMYSMPDLLLKNGISRHVQRWYNLIKGQPCVQQALNKLRDLSKPLPDRSSKLTEVGKSGAKSVPRKKEGKFVELPGAEKGKLIVRFPPEASGYLHIGHAKAALLNQYYQQAFQGKLIMRFDDTNPAKENAEFEKVILEDLKMLQIKPDLFSHTSQHFDVMLGFCEQLLHSGNAYVDDTDPENMKNDREQRTESKHRNNAVAKNIGMWTEMLAGSEKGQKCCVRAKIDMSSANGCLRDPTIYRCKNELHPRTGNKYKVYPTYDFACPIVDAIEGVTHTLRTTEYHDRDEQFYWFIDVLKLRKPYIWEYSRLNMTNTVLSKRKLTWFVAEGLVDGWDDPRFPTVRGIIRQGMTVEGLKEFIIAQGSSKSVVFMNWDKIWAFNKKVIDPVAPRYTALEKDNHVVVNVKGATQMTFEVPAHPKNNDIGTKTVYTSPRILIDYADANTLKEGENATFINWGNLMISKIHKCKDGKIEWIDADLNLENKDFKSTLKLTWLSQMSHEDYTPIFCVYFDHIISKPILNKEEDFKQFTSHKTRFEVEMMGDPELKKCKKGDIIQLQRRGYFKVDSEYSIQSLQTGAALPVVLFSIPDGHTKDSLPASTSSMTQTNNVKRREAVRNNRSNITQLHTLPVRTLNTSNLDMKTFKETIDKDTVLSSNTVEVNQLIKEIEKIGSLIRQLKSQNAKKEDINTWVKQLLVLKNEYEVNTGNQWQPSSAQIATSGKKSKSKKSSNNKGATNDETRKTGMELKAASLERAPRPEPIASSKLLLPSQSSETRSDSAFKKKTRLGLEAKKEINLSDWYSQVITKSELIEYYDVSGCYILRYWSFAIWKIIKNWFDVEITKLGVKECYFPIFVSRAALEREKTHITDFAPEVAWVTRSGESEMAEPIAVRPTSETVMYPAYAKWIQSYRDLPIKLNQWNNVVRWEFKHPQPFLRTREFLWQEGHTAFSTSVEAQEEVLQILDLYAQIYTNLLAVPVIKGRKTEKEKFAGGDYTTTVEAFIAASGRAIQGATSHHLGQNFSKMFDIVFEDPETLQKQYAWQNSWGITTRTIGVMIMVHADNQGLILPPRVACIQIIIVPCGVTVNTSAKEKQMLLQACTDLEKALKVYNVRVEGDYRDNYSPGWKFNYWELKGVPIRVELGPKDLIARQLIAVRRDTGEKMAISICDANKVLSLLLESIQESMLAKAAEELRKHTQVTKDWNQFRQFLDAKNIIMAPFCGTIECEDRIKSDSASEEVEAGAPAMGAKGLCIPFEQPAEISSGEECIHPACGIKPKFYTLFGRSY